MLMMNKTKKIPKESLMVLHVFSVPLTSLFLNRDYIHLCINALNVTKDGFKTLKRLEI